MASKKPILRSIFVLALVLGIGWFGLWFLGNSRGFKVENPKQKIDSQPITIDEYGGKTPRETLNLLIAALEKNNIDLALKYFTPELQEAQSHDLKKLQDAKLLADLVKTLKGIKNGKNLSGNRYQFDVPEEETGEIIAEIEMKKNETGFWTIASF